MESLFSNHEVIDKELIQFKLKKTHEIVTDLVKEFSILYPTLGEVEEFKIKVDKMDTCLKQIDLQLSFLNQAIQLSSDEEIVNLKEKHPEIKEKYEKLKERADISYVPLGSALNFLLDKLLPDTKEVIELASKKIEVKKGSDTFKEIVADLQVVQAKLDAVLEYLPDAACYLKTDIFAENRDTETWQELLKHCVLNRTVPKESIRKHMKKFSRMVNMANAAISKTEQNPKALNSHFAVASKMFYFSNNEEEAKKEAALFLSDPNIDSMLKVLSIQDSAIIQKIAELHLPPIQYDQIVYLERLFPKIDKKYISEEYEKGTINKITPMNFEVPDLEDRKKDILENIFKKKDNSVKVRILSPNYLVLQGKMKEKITKTTKGIIKNIFGPISRPHHDGIDGIIFHVHGGGFVAMSSATHRNHTIIWAKTLNKIIFSVDYGLAPDSPYPEGLDDVWQAYNWVVNYAESVLGIKTDKIIVAGDSAGGNLITSLTLLAIKAGIRVPDACYAFYPALNLYQQMYTPSYFLAIDDPMLPFSCLRLCLKAYVPDEYKPREDPLLSPIHASDELLEKLPPFRIATGENDPLHDDSWRFLNRLVKLKKNVKMYVYTNMPHGFISMGRMEHFELVIAETCGIFRELFEL